MQIAEHNLLFQHSLQKRILKRGIEMLAEGGKIVYSTCSFNPVEDEAVVAHILRTTKGQVQSPS